MLRRAVPADFKCTEREVIEMGEMADYYMECEWMEGWFQDQRDEAIEQHYKLLEQHYKLLDQKYDECLAMERRAEGVKRRWELQFLKNIVLKREK